MPQSAVSVAGQPPPKQEVYKIMTSRPVSSQPSSKESYKSDTGALFDCENDAALILRPKSTDADTNEQRQDETAGRDTTDGGAVEGPRTPTHVKSTPGTPVTPQQPPQSPLRIPLLPLQKPPHEPTTSRQTRPQAAVHTSPRQDGVSFDHSYSMTCSSRASSPRKRATGEYFHRRHPVYDVRSLQTDRNLERFGFVLGGKLKTTTTSSPLTFLDVRNRTLRGRRDSTTHMTAEDAARRMATLIEHHLVPFRCDGSLLPLLPLPPPMWPLTATASEKFRSSARRASQVSESRRVSTALQAPAASSSASESGTSESASASAEPRTTAHEDRRIEAMIDRHRARLSAGQKGRRRSKLKYAVALFHHLLKANKAQRRRARGRGEEPQALALGRRDSWMLQLGE